VVRPAGGMQEVVTARYRLRKKTGRSARKATASRRGGRGKGRGEWPCMERGEERKRLKEPTTRGGREEKPRISHSNDKQNQKDDTRNVERYYCRPCQERARGEWRKNVLSDALIWSAYNGGRSTRNFPSTR